MIFSLTQKLKRLQVDNSFIERRATLLIALLLFSLIAEVAFFNIQNGGLREEVNSLQRQANTINAQLSNFSANINLVANITVTDKSSYDGIPVISIEGAIRNFGGKTAYHVGLQITAFNHNGVLMKMNITSSYGTYNYDLDAGRVSYLHVMRDVIFSTPNEESTDHIDGFSTQKTFCSIYHATHFPNGTVFKVVPVWTKAP
jgi:hypothetical protein